MSIPQSDAEKLLRPLPHFGATATPEARDKAPNRFAVTLTPTERGQIIVRAADYYLAEGFVVFRDTAGLPLQAMPLSGIFEIGLVGGPTS